MGTGYHKMLQRSCTAQHYMGMTNLLAALRTLSASASPMPTESTCHYLPLPPEPEDNTSAHSQGIMLHMFMNIASALACVQYEPKQGMLRCLQLLPAPEGIIAFCVGTGSSSIQLGQLRPRAA